MQLVTRRPELTAVIQGVATPAQLPATRVKMPSTQVAIYRELGMFTPEAQNTQEVQRLKKATQRYEPFTPPNTWFFGRVEPRESTVRESLPVFLAVGVLAFAAPHLVLPLFGISFTSFTAGLLTSAFSVMGAVIPGIPIYGIWDSTKESQRRARMPRGLFDYATYSEPMPIPAIQAYNTAKSLGIFEEILVYSPNSRAFSSPRPAGDPLLVGIIGQYHFLIHAWNLAEDIKWIEANGGSRAQV